MDKEKVEWIVENLEILVSMLKEEFSKKETSIDPFATVHPIDSDEDIEYYEEED